jgi:hypothetical protein
MELNVDYQGPVGPWGEPEVKLQRWQVFFASRPGWYPVGEFMATDETSAIDRAVEVLGPGSAYRAEQIPWDAAPLPRLGR